MIKLFIKIKNFNEKNLKKLRKIEQENKMSNEKCSQGSECDMQALKEENEKLSKQIEQMTQTLSILTAMIAERSTDGQLPPYLAELLNDFNEK